MRSWIAEVSGFGLPTMIVAYRIFLLPIRAKLLEAARGTRP
jgi:hypothetical protein